MFETSQEESGAGAAKIVGGVIAVVVVLLVVVYFVFLKGSTSTTGAKPAATKTAASGEKPDPMRDLHIVGQPNLHRDPATQTQAVWDFRVENRSKSTAYKDIQYVTTYYDAQGAATSHQGTLNEQVDPADQHTFSVNEGLYPMGTTRYTIELKGAQPVQ